MLDFKTYTMINESVRSELFKSGMLVSYSKTGKSCDYHIYLCITEKPDIEKALDKLKWPTLFSPTDESNILNDKYGVLVTSREEGVEYVLISEVLANNILYIWDTGLKMADVIKDKYLKDLKEYCKPEKLIYEKDVDLKNIVTLFPDEPCFNHGFRASDLYGMTSGSSTYNVPNKLSTGSLSIPGSEII